MPIDFACKSFELEDVIRCGLALTKSDYKVMRFLVKNKEEMKSQDISKELLLDLSTVQRALKKLYEKEAVLRSQKNLANGGYVYVYRANSKDVIKKIVMKVINRWVKTVEDNLDRW